MGFARRISGVFGMMECPGCQQWVLPLGEACPKCKFPISRFLSRKRWFPWFLVGLAMTLLSGASFVILFVPHGNPGSWVGMAWLMFAAVSLALLAVGALGVITGGPHTKGQSMRSSDWKPGQG